MTLNHDKFQLNLRSIKFLGHLIDQDVVRADPDKTAAIRDMDTPNPSGVSLGQSISWGSIILQGPLTSVRLYMTCSASCQECLGMGTETVTL